MAVAFRIPSVVAVDLTCIEASCVQQPHTHPFLTSPWLFSPFASKSPSTATSNYSRVLEASEPMCPVAVAALAKVWRLVVRGSFPSFHTNSRMAALAVLRKHDPGNA